MTTEPGRPVLPRTADPSLQSDIRELSSGDWEDARHPWEEAFSRSEGVTAFVSPEWTAAWVEEFGADLRPELLALRDAEGRAAAACLLTLNRRTSVLGEPERLHVNTDGEPELDSVIIEHNRPLCAPGFEWHALRQLAARVDQYGIRELRVAGADERWVERFCQAFADWQVDIEWRWAPFVDLCALRSTGRTHLATVSRNTRAQLRRSISEYERRGPLTLSVGTSADESMLMLEELMALHSARWQSRGQPGAFASVRRLRFHRRFVARAAAGDGVAQLMRVCSGDETIGILYNLVAGGQVSFYQSGFRYEASNRLKPGLLCHHLAIEHYRSRGLSEYDFLVSAPGEGRYKLSLSTGNRRLGWLTLRRPSWRAPLRRLARRVRETFSPARHRDQTDPTEPAVASDA